MGRGGIGTFSITSMMLIGFLAYIVLGSGPVTRMERTCKPVSWTQNLSVSVLQLVNASKAVPATSRWFHNANYGCEYMLWRLFYQTDYIKQHQATDASNRVPPTQTTVAQ